MGCSVRSSADALTAVRVRLRFTRRTATPIIGRLLLSGVSVAFIVGGAADPASFGGVLFLVLGAAGILLFTGSTLALAGNVLARRPVLEIDDDGIRRPGGWPRRASHLLAWDDLAAVCAWSQGIQGRHHLHHLTFLPRGDADKPPSGAEILAIKVKGVPGVPEPRWSFPVGAWDRTVEDIVAAVRRHRDVPFADRRDGKRSPRKRPRRTP
jgi:hypothetical protein